MDCNACKSSKAESANSEGEAMRQHIIIKRLIAVIVLLIVLLVGTNVAWLYF